MEVAESRKGTWRMFMLCGILGDDGHGWGEKHNGGCDEQSEEDDEEDEEEEEDMEAMLSCWLSLEHLLLKRNRKKGP